MFSGVFRDKSNIYDEAFCVKIVIGSNAVNYFHKKAPS